MAEPIVKVKSKDHRRRKSPGSRDFFDKQRFERNAARPKQRYDEVKGLWTREPIGGEEA